jgi:hypothetical protein
MKRKTVEQIEKKKIKKKKNSEKNILKLPEEILFLILTFITNSENERILFINLICKKFFKLSFKNIFIRQIFLKYCDKKLKNVALDRYYCHNSYLLGWIVDNYCEFLLSFYEKVSKEEGFVPKFFLLNDLNKFLEIQALGEEGKKIDQYLVRYSNNFSYSNFKDFKVFKKKLKKKIKKNKKKNKKKNNLIIKIKNND